MSADKLAETIWETNRADEGTISAAGADIVTRAIRERFFVIDRDDLPEVGPERPGYSEYVYIGGEVHGLKASVEQYDDAIRELVALREYRREHPWVDEKAVDELQNALTAYPFVPHETARSLARSLIADGWTKAEVTR